MIYGIDLGTTNSVISIYENGSCRTILVDDQPLLPSVVSLADEGFVVGQSAKNRAILEPERTIASIKRKMGQDTDLEIGDKKMRPEEISSLILKKLKLAAISDGQLDESAVFRAVVTVPAYFTEEQRQATIQAAELAEIKVERIINEPTAASLAFGLSSMEEALYAIYDFGGGTFDVSVIESEKGLVEVLSSTGNNLLGGDDLDDLLASHIWEAFAKKHQLTTQAKSLKVAARLKHIAEQTKIQLSSSESVELKESFFYTENGVTHHLEDTISRQTFEDLILEKVTETIHHLKKAIDEASIEEEELDGIVLVGGSSRIPFVQQMIEQKFGIVPILIDHPNEAISHGATIQGAIIDNIDTGTILVDITPHTLGVGVLDDTSYSEESTLFFRKHGSPNLMASSIVAKNTPIPATRKHTFFAAVPFQEKYLLQIYQGEKPRFLDNQCIGELTLEVKNPPEDGVIEVSFDLDINGILKVTAIETNTQQKVTATFKSSRGAKIKAAALEEVALLSMDEASTTLVNRVDHILLKDINEEDKTELKDLVKKYKEAMLSKNNEVAAEVEIEMLDLLYYLENED